MSPKMSAAEPHCRIEATPAAVEAIDRLRAEHGEIVLHLPGGAEDAGSPICLLDGELRIGPRDVFIGSVHGVSMYEQASRSEGHFRTGWVVSLDLVPGYPPGFSIRPAEGMRFAISDSRPAVHAEESR